MGWASCGLVVGRYSQNCPGGFLSPTPPLITRWSSQLKMIESVLRLFQKDPLWQTKLKTTATLLTLKTNISSRYDRYYTNKHKLLASVLDPPFKTEWIIRDKSVCNKLREIRDLLVEETE